MKTDLQGKVAVVTGASRGLGQCVALRLADSGADVALIARSQAALDDTAQQIAALGVRATVFASDLGKLDVAQTADIKSAVERQLGTPSILVNGAGIFGPIRLFKDVDPSAWLETLAINTLSPILLARAFVGGMIDGGWGRIVNFTSAASLHHPGPLNSAYATSKVALNQFTRHLAAELEGTGVTANVIHPGDVKTEMWAVIQEHANALGAEGEPYRQWARWVDETGGDDPEKASDLVLDLMSGAAANVSGQFLWIKDGLQAPIPSWGEPTNTQPWRE
jgi:NAD(P)-dependent dehydrogenase (short-subunit alcohol dehydrogenase family)